MKLLTLILTTLVAWLGLTLVAVSLDGERHGWFSSIAMVLCLVPSVGTLILATKMEHRSPVESIGAVLVGPLIRLIAVSLGGLILWRAIPLLRHEPLPFWSWVLGFYLLTLVVETTVLLIGSGSRPK